jgi:VanZ family protein
MMRAMFDALLNAGHLRFHRLWLGLGLLMVAAIFYFSLTAPVLHTKGHWDKLFHLLAYLLVTGWFAQLYPKLWMRLLIGLLFALMGVLIEFLQSFHPLRYLDVADMLANSVGVIIALALVETWLGSMLANFERLLPGAAAEDASRD